MRLSLILLFKWRLFLERLEAMENNFTILPDCSHMVVIANLKKIGKKKIVKTHSIRERLLFFI